MLVAPIAIDYSTHLDTVTAIVETAAEPNYLALVPPIYAPVFSSPELSLAAREGAMRQIREISKLADGWDGYGGLRVPDETLAHATRLIEVSSIASAELPIPEITPNSNGTISFEWNSGAGDAHVEIGRTRYSGHIRLKGGWTTFLEGQTAEIGVEVVVLVAQLLYDTNAFATTTHTVQVVQPTT
jgi:hypothetical protein